MEVGKTAVGDLILHETGALPLFFDQTLNTTDGKSHAVTRLVNL